MESLEYHELSVNKLTNNNDSDLVVKRVNADMKALGQDLGQEGKVPNVIQTNILYHVGKDWSRNPSAYLHVAGLYNLYQIIPFWSIICSN